MARGAVSTARAKHTAGGNLRGSGDRAGQATTVKAADEEEQNKDKAMVWLPESGIGRARRLRSALGDFSGRRT